MNPLHPLLLNLWLTLGITLALWIISLPLRNASIVDIYWGLGFGIIAWATLAQAPAFTTRGLLVAILTTVWGMRLAGYLAWRNIGKGEDYRYRAMREKWQANFALVSLFFVFWLQGLIMWTVAVSIQVAVLSRLPFNTIDMVGIVLFTTGWIFESTGDYQLARFKSNPENEGQVMDQGLWKYTRHPNYFGDFLVWWGFFVVAVGAGGWWTLFSPVLMSFLLLRVSGVPLLERSLMGRRPGYADYVSRTSSFFPWPRRGA